MDTCRANGMLCTVKECFVYLNEFPEMRDVKDSPILATAIMESIDVFLTGDKDFLVLDVETPEILTMKEFLEQY